MNKLVFNYKAQVGNVVNGRTFDARLDFGFRQFQDFRIQMQSVELPDERSKDIVVKESLDRAKTCLRMALMGTGENPQGRRIVVASTQPSKRNLSYFRCYVPANRENIECPPLCAKYAGLRFMDVNNFMQLLAERQFDLVYAADLLETFELHDMY